MHHHPDHHTQESHGRRRSVTQLNDVCTDTDPSSMESATYPFSLRSGRPDSLAHASSYTLKMLGQDLESVHVRIAGRSKVPPPSRVHLRATQTHPGRITASHWDMHRLTSTFWLVTRAQSPHGIRRDQHLGFEFENRPLLIQGLMR